MLMVSGRIFACERYLEHYLKLYGIITHSMHSIFA
jgi:hypothetical protein